MQRIAPWSLFLAALFCGSAVILGAFAAHGLKAALSPYALDIFGTGVRYQMWHGLSLFGLALLGSRVSPRTVGIVVLCWSLGMLLFSGSLYGLALGGPRWLGPITPLGGTCMILGWLSLAVAAWPRSLVKRVNDEN